RGHQRIRVLEVTTATGDVRAIVDEFSDTFIQYSSDGKMELKWLKDGKLLWASERTGWNHLYRYDTASGTLLNAVTSGDWNVRRIEHIDEESGHVWFFAVGLNAGQDPYHEHFCRANLDGSGFVQLTDGDGTHAIEWSPDKPWLIDRYSRVDLPPVTELRAADDGKLVCRLEEADAREIIAARGGLPERFVAKGRDGTTDIWGIIHRPKDFDASRSYAVIENIYAGPHDHHVPKEFRGSFGQQQAIADRGFMVVQIDGMGTAWRSKAFHDVCYRNLKDAGFPDRMAWMKAAKEKFTQMDLTRVGIYGGSAGGQNAMAALVWHSDFYKVAIADCGCHDNRMDKIWWNEQWMGVPEGDVYANNSNMEHAGQLQGHLMLVVGELDRNVDPATTMQVAKRLVDSGKEFDLIVVPGAGHGACETPWASSRRLKFFETHLGSVP
ncbi:MAG: prolyl oligopeptidase family serine peptidase, partial [Fuerstia sp.]|nr:prolyl oligopeptidase family serine peptidase [Fuerstiella sp.]